MEIQATLFWTPDFIERFEAARGYSPIKFLPLLFHQATSYHANEPPYDTTYVLWPSESGQSKYLQDYRLTLNEGYQEYLGSYEEWAKSIGVTHSCQVAYNMPVDMVSTESPRHSRCFCFQMSAKNSLLTQITSPEARRHPPSLLEFRRVLFRSRLFPTLPWALPARVAVH